MARSKQRFDNYGDDARPCKPKGKAFPAWAVVLIVAVPFIVLLTVVGGVAAWWVLGRSTATGQLAVKTVDPPVGGLQQRQVDPPKQKDVVVVEVPELLANLRENEARNTATLDGKRCRFWVRFKSLKTGDHPVWSVLTG